jgi:CspA family cold shock protein
MGRLKTWREDRGFGFIQPDDGGDDVFCHVTRLLDGLMSPPIGARVQYDVRPSRRDGRLEAVNVAIAANAPLIR